MCVCWSRALLETGTLPSAALGIGHSEKKQSAKPSLPSVICRALGKAFAECRPDTQQRKIAVNGDGCFASVSRTTLGKEFI